MIAKLISGFFSNLSVILLFLALAIAGVRSLKKPLRRKNAIAEEFFRWTTLLAAGTIGIYAFVMHAFFPKIAAAAIGWGNSPFQYEVAVANLGFGLLCVLAFRAAYGFWLASVVGITCWLWGDAVGHVRQMITAGNFSPGNAGPWFWSDVLVPLLLIVSISLIRKPHPGSAYRGAPGGELSESSPGEESA